MKYILFLILFSFQLLANNFISDINLNKKLITIEELEALVIDHANTRKSYLSLGESHLQADTVLPQLFKFASLFSDNKNRFDLCAEDIPHVVKYSFFKQISQLAKKTIISEGNNPHFTDFRDCNKSKNISKIYYSGFFHQFPFARAYPFEFAQVPVVTKPGNNIWKQNNHQSLFITMMEMIHLTSTATHEVFFNVYNPEELHRKYNALLDKVRAIKSRMQPINQHTSTYKKKWAYIASSAHLGTVARKYSPKQAYFIITELDYRKQTDDLHFLSKFTKLARDFQNKIIAIGPRSKYLVGTYQTAGKKGDLDGSTRYGTMPYHFELGTTFFQFKTNNQNLLMVSEPSRELLRFFNMESKVEIDFDQLEKLAFND